MKKLQIILQTLKKWFLFLFSKKRKCLKCSDLKINQIILYQDSKYRAWFRVIKINQITQQVKIKHNHITLWLHKEDFDNKNIFETFKKETKTKTLYY